MLASAAPGQTVHKTLLRHFAGRNAVEGVLRKGTLNLIIGEGQAVINHGLFRLLRSQPGGNAARAALHDRKHMRIKAPALRRVRMRCACADKQDRK